MAKSRIVLTAEADLKDEELREVVSRILKKIENINNRTKRHTIDLKIIDRRLDELKEIKDKDGA